MKMRHKETKEIVVVVGLCLKPDKGYYAKCLCDARLHPERAHKNQVMSGTVECEFPFKCLKPVVAPDWDEIKELYGEGEYESIISKKWEEHTRNVQNTGNSIYNQERAKLIEDGMDEETAEYLANQKRRDFMLSRLNPQSSENKPVIRDTNW